MKDSKQSNEAIEKATLSTIQAFEMLKELQTDLKQKTRRVNAIKAKAKASQKKAVKTQKKFEEDALKFLKEQKEFQLKIKELEHGNELLKSKNEIIATQLATHQKRLCEMDQLKKECLELKKDNKVFPKQLAEFRLKIKELNQQIANRCLDLKAALKEKDDLVVTHRLEIEKKDDIIKTQQLVSESKDELIAKQKQGLETEIKRKDAFLANQRLEFEAEIKRKDELIAKQLLEIDLKNVECLKFKKMSKKYNKALNTVSPQVVNNVQFVKKFPILESRCNSLLEKLDQTEKERDMLLLKLNPVRANSCTGSSYKDKLARRDALMINQLSSSNQARHQLPQFVARQASYVPPLSTLNYQSQKAPPTYISHGIISQATPQVPPSHQAHIYTSQPTPNQTLTGASLAHNPGSLPVYARNTIPISRSSASISHVSGLLPKPTSCTPTPVSNTPLRNTSPIPLKNILTSNMVPTFKPVVPVKHNIPLSDDPTPLTITPSTLSNTPTTLASMPSTPRITSPTPESFESTTHEDTAKITTENPSSSNRKRSLLNRSVRSAPELRLLAPASDKIILRDRIGLAERKKQKIES
ncbi:hypothetical protein INT47_004463 [Mucor saturninus]|uniref:Uncharacterized protein n=1 Tax=Mucor saturninus TaxID=64648 RepID=A0A8H7QTJ6_9FUNG|nr:hypothetical protein INT47_004463 [Mucor saturninus]